MEVPQSSSVPFSAKLPAADNLPQPDGWRFVVRCPDADQVMLVAEDALGFSSWLPMTAEQKEAGTWTLELPKASAAGPVRYYTIEGGSVLNCGTAGLTATRIDLVTQPKGVTMAVAM